MGFGARDGVRMGSRIGMGVRDGDGTKMDGDQGHGWNKDGDRDRIRDGGQKWG